MEILEKIGDAASKTYKYTAEKTTKIAKETKLKMKISDYKKEIETIYREIGETVYEKFVEDKEIDKTELMQKCEEIDLLTEKIVNCKNEILKLRERRQCKNCYEEIEITANYCPNCGFEQETIQIKKAEDKQQEEAETNEDSEDE
ncbi:MAG: zinc ribbon domain-containing protein [Clostridia bacterium]|nr:zinc ribbon domain-containing protein [Clostridia bacterium]